LSALTTEFHGKFQPIDGEVNWSFKNSFIKRIILEKSCLAEVPRLQHLL
jgi:hypothetical protein